MRHTYNDISGEVTPISLTKEVQPPLRFCDIELPLDSMEAIPQHGVHLDKLSPIARNEVFVITRRGLAK
eukprot:1438087-Amphidinium_carterae.1